MYKLFITYFLLISISFSQQDRLIYDQLINSEGNEYFNVPIGLCEDYPEETTTMEFIRKDFELMNDLGIKLLRISFGWDAIEAEKDNYNWLFWDEYVKTGVEQFGLTFIPYICYNPQWNAGEDTARFWNHPPNDYDEFYQFMFDIVTRYKDYIKSWELWNEPNLPTYWQGTEAEFAELIRTGSKAVKDADPEAIVVLGGMAASRPGFFHNLFRYHDVSDYVDVVNLHNYYETWQFYPVEKITDLIKEYVYTIDLFGNDQALWIAEVGYSTYRNNRKVSDAYYATYAYEHTPEYQAVDLVKRISLILSTGNVDAVAWYEIKDLPQEEEVIGDEFNNRYLGIAYPDHTYKPAAQSLKFVNSLFDVDFKVYEDVLLQKKAGSDIHLNSFITNEGDVILIAWLQTNMMGEDNRHHSQKDLIKDMREEELIIDVPGAFKKVTLFNELGESTEFMNYNTDNSITRIPSLKLQGGEITILKLEAEQ